MAKARDQFQAKDVTFWGVFALAAWAVAVLGANVSALIPDGVLGGLHASRLDGATLNQLRSEIVALDTQATQLTAENAVLVQRLILTEQAGTDAARRVAALEQSVPKLMETLNNTAAGVDTGAVTASTGTAARSFDADGGSVSYTTTPLPGSVTAPAQQPMPKPLTAEAAPDAAAFGIALGPPLAAEQAPGAWQGLTDRIGTLLIGLTPILGHVEGGAGRRLVAGPIASEADARDLCGRMAKLGIACQSVPFTGDPLPAH